jgi:hypothetical protein
VNVDLHSHLTCVCVCVCVCARARMTWQSQFTSDQYRSHSKTDHTQLHSNTSGITEIRVCAARKHREKLEKEKEKEKTMWPTWTGRASCVSTCSVFLSNPVMRYGSLTCPETTSVLRQGPPHPCGLPNPQRSSVLPNLFRRDGGELTSWCKRRAWVAVVGNGGHECDLAHPCQCVSAGVVRARRGCVNDGLRVLLSVRCRGWRTLVSPAEERTRARSATVP